MYMISCTFDNAKFVFKNTDSICVETKCNISKNGTEIKFKSTLLLQ